MEGTSLQLQSESISCSICLELLKDPVTTACGHNYCKKCINDCWDVGAGKDDYSCPQCRQEFTSRPALKTNTMLAELLENLKKVVVQGEPDESCYAGPEDVACDVCTGSKLKAHKSCLMCLVSYCDNHLKSHMDRQAFGSHKLAEPSKRLQEVVCSRHDTVMTVFCSKDQQVFCSICASDEHKGHDVTSTVAARDDREKDLRHRQKQVQERMQTFEGDCEMLLKEAEKIEQSADKTVDHSNMIYDEIILQIQGRKAREEETIRTWQKTELSSLNEHIEEVQKEVSELKRLDHEFGALLGTEDNVVFLQSIVPDIKETALHQVHIPTDSHFENHRRAVVSQFKYSFQNLLQGEWKHFEPETREDFLRYYIELTLDQKSAHQKILLTDKNRRATLERNSRRSSNSHPNRFTKHWQVLTTETLTGRCYFEVERAGGDIAVALVYKSICKAGAESLFGNNAQSWSLSCGSQGWLFQHNGSTFHISDVSSLRVGVYLDQAKGVLSFYRVTDSVTLLHTVQTTFTRPLHAGLRLYDVGTIAELLRPSIDASDC